MRKKVAVILADGFEEIEAVTPIDVLRRAGCEVTVVGLTSKTATGAHQLKVECDTTLEIYKDVPDALILPGGMPGAQNLRESKQVKELVKLVHANKKLVGAICAAPALALTPTGILEGKRATCYPGFEKEFSPEIHFSADRVVKDANIVTSRGPGSALEFAYALVEELIGTEKASELQNGMIFKAPAFKER